MSGEVMKLKGYILVNDEVSRDETDSEDENEEEEQQPEFLDMAEMDSVASGGHLFHARVHALQTVNFQTFSENLFRVEGRFALRNPWWEVHCSVQPKGNRFVVKGIPSYKLRSDLDRQGWISIVSLFLKACKIEEVIISLLFDWLPPNRDINLYNVAEVISEFSEAGNKGPAQDIAARISCSVAGMQVHAACLYPRVMKYLPTLLPRQFTDLLCQGKKRPTLPTTQALRGGLTAQQEGGSEQEELDMSLLNQLELIIANDVWKLGFSTLVHKELKLVRCEARLMAFMECNLFQKIPPLQQRSLRVYEQIKKKCFDTGSTFVERGELCASFSKTMSDEQVWDAIHFLKEQGVVVLDKQKVVIQNFHLYETGITKCLCTLVDHGKWTIPVNARKVLFAAAEERQREKMQNIKTAHSAEGGPSNPDPTSIPYAHGNENPSVKSDGNTEPQNPSPVSSKQQAGTDSGLSPVELDIDHIQAAEMICANPVTIISGKAGCGKTTVISQLFKAAVQSDSSAPQITEKTFTGYENDLEASPASPSYSEPEDEQRAVCEKEILLTAPTGRAASLLAKKTGFSAYTLHQVMFSFMTIQKAQQEEIAKRWKFKDVRILVVDEGSMVPVELLHSVLSILTQHAQLRKFIILGDIRQLPSIRPGNILDNLFYSLKPLRWAIEMRTNHRTESQLIVKNAGLIADMGERHRFRYLEYDTKVDLGSSFNTLSADNKFILIRLPSGGSDELQRAVEFLIDTAPGLVDHVTSQFIAFKRKDVALINELCCKHYNNHTTKNHKNKLVFQPGDKVCCTRNGYLNPTEDEDGMNQQSGPIKEKASLRLCNGEIFFITADKTEEDNQNRRRRYVTLDDKDGRLLTLDYRELMRECKLQHAWARTIHTFQGSENETIVFVVGDGNAQTWKHIYTAVTRGQKRVYVVSSEKAIESAIQRREIPRKTRLGGLVKEQLVQPWMLHRNTPLGAQSDCSPQQSTPQGAHTPCRPQSSNFQSIPLQPKCLWKTDKGEQEAEQSPLEENLHAHSSRQQPAEQDSAAALTGNKRKKMLSAEHQDVPHKQPHIAAQAAEQCGDAQLLEHPY